MQDPLFDEQQQREFLLNLDRRILECSNALTDALDNLANQTRIHQEAIERGDSADVLERLQQRVSDMEKLCQEFKDRILTGKKQRDDFYKTLRRGGIEL